MAPAAAAADSHEASRWSEEMYNNVELELASSSGNGSEAAGEVAAGEDHGWKKVTNPKKQRQREKKLREGGDAGLGQDGKNTASGVDGKAFESLEMEAVARKARRKSRQDAWTADAAATANGVHHGSDDEELSDGEFEDRGQARPVASSEVKKKPKKAKKPKVSIADAAATIDVVDLAAYLGNLSDSFVPDVQLIRCVDYFVKVFSSVSAQISWENLSKEPFQKSIQVPIQDIPESVCKVTSNWLAQKPVDALSEFTLWALDHVIFDSPVQQKSKNSGVSAASNNKTQVAVIVVLALLLRKKHEALLSIAELLRGPRFQGPTKLYVMSWMYGQVAHGDLLAGLSLWVQNMLPFAVGSTSTLISRQLALQFFESVILAGDAKKTRAILLSGASRKERLVPPAALIALLHMAYPHEVSRTKATERFLAIYPTVKEVALGGSSRSKALKQVAQQLLPLALAAAGEDTPGLSREGCSLFRWCLFQAPESYKQWERLHCERFKASVRVVEFLREEWKESVSLLSPLNDLKTTIAALRVQNRKMVAEKKDEAAVRRADEQCKAVQKKMSRFPSCVKASATLICVAAGSYGFYLLNPNVNPWKWDGGLLLSKSHAFL